MKNLFVKYPFFYMKRLLHRYNIIFFMIHGVVDETYHSDWEPLRKQHTVKQLREGLSFFSKYYDFISMDEAIDMLKGKIPIKPYSAVLTFDDGYRNNITHALPLLRTFKVPATFFLSTGHVDRRKPYWYDRLDYAIQHLKKDQKIYFRGEEFDFIVARKELLIRTFKKLRQSIKTDNRSYMKTMDDVDKIASILECNAGCCLDSIFEDDHFTAIMTWEEAKFASDRNIIIGSHTVDHVILDKVDEISVKDQLNVSKMMIQQNIGKDCLYFCYPSAVWNRRVVSLVKEAGYTAAITTDSGTNVIGGELMTLYRESFPKVCS